CQRKVIIPAMTDTPELSEKQKITLWFVYLRWGAILLLLAVIFTSIYPGRLQFPIYPNMILIGFVALYNLIYPFFVKRFRFFSENIVFTYLRVTVDLAVISLIIHFTGGAESQFKLIYLLEFTAIAITGFEQIAYFLAAQGSIFYLIVCYLEAYSYVPHYNLIKEPSALYLNVNYGVSKALALFLCSALLIYFDSYLADRLREKQRQIEELSNAQLDFMNMVIHEVKSPLTSIIGYSDLLNNQKLGPVSEAQKEPLAVIKRQSHRILELATDLLDLARLESGKTKITEKPTVISEVASLAVEEVQPLSAARKLTLVQEFDPATPPVNLDEDKIHQVFTNLLTNAIKFSNEGAKIFISIRPENKDVLVSVRDEGLGIDPRDLPHIFDKFYRASKESAERKGTGLGLVVSKSIIKAHGGSIWAVSAGSGQGAVFYFTLPL
ncbi:MAG: HAMP domain-containing sensor histidine kinase, partial [Candidatus Margulisbacteria bacterium]|nr:HAMP domain-containing sensor histidine kinase [Candidatus Margulisiibacteriota bacterium]